MLSNGFVPSWEHNVNCTSPGRYMVQGTSRGYTIMQGGPPLFHLELGLHNELCGKDETKPDPDAGPNSHWYLLLPARRDGLLGACVREHVASIPLYTDSDLNRTTCHLHLSFNFALSMPQIKSLPLVDIESTCDARFYEPWAPNAEEINGQFEDWNIALIDGIVYPGSCLDVRKSFRYFHARQYPCGYTRIECTLHTREDHSDDHSDDYSELEHGHPGEGKSVEPKDEVILPANNRIVDSCCSDKGPPGVGNRDAIPGGATQALQNKRARK